MATFLHQIIKLLAPHHCLGCGVQGVLVCDRCLPAMSRPRAETCFSCNRISANFRTCRSCRRQNHLRRVIVAGHYDGLVKKLIYYLKYGNGLDAAMPLAHLLEARLENPRSYYDVIIPVPASPRRFRQRGYNQAAEIAKELSRICDIPYVNPLLRSGKSRQVGASKDVRLQQIKGKIRLGSKSSGIQGMKVLLVDDVVTTGGTLGECARVLHAAGATIIDSAVVAKH